MKKVAVVILNYNGERYLEQFLPITIANCNLNEVEIVVADNASTDSSLELMRDCFPGIRVIKNKTNDGFSTGYNLALQHVEAQYYVLLNSDIEVTPDWIDPIVKLMDSDPKIAACQPKIRSYYHKDEFEYAGACGGFIDKYGYPFCRGRLFQHLEQDNGQYDEPREVFWATGACMFVRADLYHQIGGLDDSFFAHMEEIDLCWRLKNAGYKVYCCPQSVVYHIGGGTLPKNSPRKTYLNFRNNLSLLVKNLPGYRVLPVIAVRILLDWVAALKFWKEDCTEDSRMVFKAHRDFYKRLKTLRQKRGEVKHRRVSCVYRRNIVFAGFLLGKKHFSELREKDFVSMD